MSASLLACGRMCVRGVKHEKDFIPSMVGWGLPWGFELMIVLFCLP